MVTIGNRLPEAMTWTRLLTPRQAAQIHIKQPQTSEAGGHELNWGVNWGVGRFQRLLEGAVATQEDFLEESSLSSPCFCELYSLPGQQTGLLSAWRGPGFGFAGSYST